jgi:hypothetical protein
MSLGSPGHDALQQVGEPSHRSGRLSARTDVERRRIIGFANRVLFALGVAGL